MASFYEEIEDEDDAREAHRDAAIAFIADVHAEVKDNTKLTRAVSEGAYTMGELGVFIDGESYGAELLLQAWALVEALRRSGKPYPEKLRM